MWLTYVGKRIVAQLFRQHNLLGNPIRWRLFISFLWQIMDGEIADALLHESNVADVLLILIRLNHDLRRLLEELRVLEKRIALVENNTTGTALKQELRKSFNQKSRELEGLFIQALKSK